MSPTQRSSYRDAIKYENEAARYGLESQFSDWKKKVSDLQSQMRDNQMQLRKANRRYEQVQAAGGAGDYGTPELGRSIDKLKTDISGSKSGIVSTPSFSGYGIEDSKQLSSNLASEQAKLAQSQADLSAFTAPKLNPLDGKMLDPMLVSGMSDREFRNRQSAMEREVKASQSKIDETSGLLGEQQEFERQEQAAADRWKADLTQKEQDFIKSILSEPEPTEPSIRGMKVEKTPQQIEAERADVINSSMETRQPVQKTNAKFDMYLAKNNGRLPLAGFNAANLRSAKNRVQGATLGGNTNKLIGG
jgi:hypothetical protein